jgi:hypothetical protein
MKNDMAKVLHDGKSWNCILCSDLHNPASKICENPAMKNFMAAVTRVTKDRNHFVHFLNTVAPTI